MPVPMNTTGVVGAEPAAGTGAQSAVRLRAPVR
jgi:hypothetical protein